MTVTLSVGSIESIIATRQRDIGGGLAVGRVLPAARKMVGPFIYFDHMGPLSLPPGRGVDVRPHPHIGLATVTYLFAGAFVHRDSLGSEQRIEPGAVNWMTAGGGIVHSERSPDAARAGGVELHGLQLWVALPRDVEECAPSFQHIAAEAISNVQQEGVKLRVLAGTAYGVTSSARVHSPLFYVEARMDVRSTLNLPSEHEERALYIVEGTLVVDNAVFTAGTMLVFHPSATPHIQAQGAAHVMLLGGAPLDGERHISWNFISSSRERIEKAKQDWAQQRFPKIPGDDVDVVRLPEHLGRAR